MGHSLVDKQLSKPMDISAIQCEQWMKKLVRRASKIGLLGEIPVSAVILDKKGYCIGRGSNNRESQQDPLGHAEIIALKQAALIKNDWRLNDCTLIVTLEPCPMCAGAIIQARMGQVVFGASDPKRGALGGVIDLSKDRTANHHMIVKRGVMQEVISQQLKDWFKLQRNSLLEN